MPEWGRNAIGIGEWDTVKNCMKSMKTGNRLTITATSRDNEETLSPTLNRTLSPTLSRLRLVQLLSR